MKSKFSGFLRGLLRKLDDSDPAAPETPRPLARPLPHADSSAPAPQAQAKPQPTGMTQTAPAATTANPDELEMPVLSVLSILPMDLRAKIIQMPAPGAMLSVPVEKVLSQLAHGSVKITFGELRAATPTTFVNSGGENDSRPVALPLNEILSRLNPALLRRNAQKRLEVSEDISGPFGGNARGISFTTTPLKAPSATPPPAAPARPSNGTAKPVAPSAAPQSFSPPPRPITPEPSAPIPFAPRPPAPMPPEKNGSDIRDIFAPSPKISAPNLPPPAPAPATPATSSPALEVLLKALMENWPEGLKKEIMQANLLNARIVLPLDLIEPGLKRGRVSMTWKNLRSQIQPMPPIVSGQDGMELDLPLKVIAPLFFAAQKAAPRATRKLSVSEEIPNLFFGFPQPQESAPAAPVAPVQPPKPATDIFLRKSVAPPQPQMPAPPQPTVPQPPATATQLPKELADTDVFLRKGQTPPPAPDISPVEFKHSAAPGTDFMSRHATPAQIVGRAMEIPGVAGAVVALPDGLKVASEVRSSVNADTIAAFLPQIIARVNQCTRELRMGDLNHLSFLVGMVQWEIFRVGGVFLAVFSEMSEALPSAQLAQLATQLERKK